MREMRENPNYAAYVGMESDRRGAHQALFQMWMREKERTVALPKKLRRGGKSQRLGRSKHEIGKRKMDREKEVGYWRGSSLARFLDGPDCLTKQEESKEHERLKDEERIKKALGTGETIVFRDPQADRSGRCLPSEKLLGSSYFRKVKKRNIAM